MCACFYTLTACACVCAEVGKTGYRGKLRACMPDDVLKGCERSVDATVTCHLFYLSFAVL